MDHKKKKVFSVTLFTETGPATVGDIHVYLEISTPLNKGTKALSSKISNLKRDVKVSRAHGPSVVSVLPAVVQVELRRQAGGLADGALLSSRCCGLRGCWGVKACHWLACLSWCLARLGVRLTHLGGCLARLAPPLSGLSYRAGLGLGAVFLCQGALLL